MFVNQIRPPWVVGRVELISRPIYFVVLSHAQSLGRTRIATVLANLFTSGVGRKRADKLPPFMSHQCNLQSKQSGKPTCHDAETKAVMQILRRAGFS